MRIILTITCVLLLLTGKAQYDEVWKPASKESEAYHEARMRLTRPPYGLAKVEKLIAKIEVDDEDNEALSPAVYNSLTLREKFTYHMIKGESFSQNCDAMPPIQEEHKKIFAQLPDMFSEYSWSQRQKDFIKTNRDSVVQWIRESIGRTKKVGLNYKHTIVEVNAKEMIPLLISTYNTTKKDLDLLTVLMLLMDANKYAPFVKSPSWKKLYSDEADYLSYLVASQANRDLIIKRATDFYHAKK